MASHRWEEQSLAEKANVLRDTLEDIRTELKNLSGSSQNSFNMVQARFERIEHDISKLKER